MALQPKLDGMRMIWTGREALSRKGKPVIGVPKLIESIASAFPDIPLDGELYCHGKSFQDIIASTRRTVNIQEDESIEYHVYDMPIEEIPFLERWGRLEALKLPSRVRLVKTNFINLHEGHTEETLNIFEGQGYEGTMARNPNSLYQFGKRTADLLKIKTFEDAEFEIIGMLELQSYEKLIVPEGTPGSNQYADGRWYKNGEATGQKTCGALLCCTPEGREFEVGSGMDDATRALYWNDPPIGKLLTVKFQRYTTNEDGSLGVPRFPIHKAIRDYE